MLWIKRAGRYKTEPKTNQTEFLYRKLLDALAFVSICWQRETEGGLGSKDTNDVYWNELRFLIRDLSADVGGWQDRPPDDGWRRLPSDDWYINWPSPTLHKHIISIGWHFENFIGAAVWGGVVVVETALSETTTRLLALNSISLPTLCSACH